MSRPSSCKQPTLTPPWWTLSCSVAWAFSSTSAESTTRRWTALVRLSPSRHRSDEKEALILNGLNSAAVCGDAPCLARWSNLTLLHTSCRTICCGTSWVPHLLMEAAQRRRWQPTGGPWNCSPVLFVVATTWASAVSTWERTGQGATVCLLYTWCLKRAWSF